MASNDHTRGIDAAVPKLWDPSNLSKGFQYDWRKYDDAAKEQYRQFKEARAKADKAR
jgi:hypothetical protein